MAGIKVGQHTIFKIGTIHLKKSKWNLMLSEEEAFYLDEQIKLFDSQLFRIAKKIILNDKIKYASVIKKNRIDWKSCFVSVVIEKDKDFDRACKGFYLNGHKFIRFIGTTGGLKNNSIIFVNSILIEELNKRLQSVDIVNKIVPAKYEAYKALTLSSSFPIPDPNGILVISDAMTKYIDNVINIDDSSDNIEPTVEIKENVELENNATDGFNLCTIEYMERVCESLGIDYISGGVCLRNKWLKGMMYPFPIKEFVEEYNNGNYIVKDIWGNEKNLNEVELVLTESSLKFWSAYNDIESYIKNYKESGYTFAVTKISPNVLENKELNYQYLQSYDFEEEDIVKLCQPTIDNLKNSMGNDYNSVVKFLGINEMTEYGTWQKALGLNEYMLKDPYIIDNIHKLIKKKINNAKIGKLLCHANFQIFSNDPFVFMEKVCGLELKGLLKRDECYSSYWVEKDIDEILAFRSPMSVHNNIRKLKVIKNEDVKKWYRYMPNIFIVNSFDSFCKAENGEDSDGDSNFTTDNEVLLNNFKSLNAILCVQRNAEKKDINEEALKYSNKLAFGNNVGEITNYITSMKDVQAGFNKDSKEYIELDKRMMCGQLYQQNCLDSIKGIVAKPMPKYWHERKACGDDEYKLSLCANKKPYFMIYRYSKEKKTYNKYIEDSYHKCVKLFKITLDDLLKMNKEDLTEEQESFISWYYKKMPVGINKCSMNEICYYVESQLDGVKSKLKQDGNFDYTILKYKRNDSKQEKEELEGLCSEYIQKIANFKSSNKIDDSDKECGMESRSSLKEYFYKKAREICKDDERLLNMVLDISYGQKKNKQFCWDIVGDLICKRLEELKIEETDNE